MACAMVHRSWERERERKKERARRAFYAIKRNTKFYVPIRIGLKILESVIEAMYNVKHQIMHAEQN